MQSTDVRTQPEKLVFCFQPRMDQYFNQMEKIIKERKTTSRIRFMLQDVLDLRRVNHESLPSPQPGPCSVHRVVSQTV